MRLPQAVFHPAAVITARITGDDSPSTARASRETGTIVHTLFHSSSQYVGKIHRLSRPTVIDTACSQKCLVGAWHTIYRIIAGRTVC